MSIAVREYGAGGAETLDGATRAALVLLSLERVKAVDLLKRLEASEVRSIAQGAERLGRVDADLIQSVISSFEKSFNDGLKFVGTADEIRSLIVEAIGEETVTATLAGAPNQEVRFEPWPALARVPDEVLRKYILAQHPQVGAFILSKVDSERVAELLRGVEISMCGDLFSRMLSISDPPIAIVRAIEETIARELLKDSGDVGAKKHEGLASILNRMDQSQTKQIIEQLAQTRPDDAKTVEKLLFRFEDLLMLPPPSLSIVVERISIERLVLALQGMPAEFQIGVLSVMSARTRRMTESELQNGGPLNSKAVSAAQRLIADEVLRMSSDGTIDLGAK